MTASDIKADAARDPLARFYDFAVSPAGFFTVLFVYVVAHVLLRLWISPVLGTDEIEQALLANDWRLGYNPRQPPLYTWILLSGYAVFGRTLLAHVVVKYGVLAAMFVASYFAGRRLLKSPQRAALASYALVLLYNVGWGAHVGYTHSLLLSVFIFLTLWAPPRAFESKRTLDYVVFGMVLGFGFLTKFSFAVFLIPLLIACLLVAPLRAGLLNWRMLVSIAVAIAILALPLNWMVHAPYAYVDVLRQVTGVDDRPSYFANVGEGLLSLGEGVLTFLAPFWLAALIFWPTLRAKREGGSPWLRAMLLGLGLTFGVLIGAVLVAQVTDFKPRYMHPILIAAPLLFFFWIGHKPANPGAERWFAGVAAIFVVGVFAGLVGQALIEPSGCKNCWLQMPAPALAGELERQGLGEGTILTENAHIGGNLRILLPRARVFSRDYGMAEAAPTGRGQCLLIWDSRMRGQAAPEPLLRFLTDRFGGAPGYGPIVYVTEPLLRGGGRTDSFGVMRVAGRSGDCTPT
ncbi:MAG: glycosyltransferase family 39 protein [Proteobacteria bacterium]|nr:glycosyltransferase family 39 protein [Pseudomonadota bacterium]